MNISCRKCGGIGFYLQQSGMQVGMYCDNCGSWLKWVGKKDLEGYKRRGIKVFPQNATITLKQNKNIGLEMVEVMPKNNVPFEVDAHQFGSNPNIAQNMGIEENIDIEKEVERRVAIRLKEMEKEVKPASPVVDEGYCPVCEGNPLEADGQSKVEVSIFSGVMTITDPDGLNIYGIYRLKRCPFCGKMF